MKADPKASLEYFASVEMPNGTPNGDANGNAKKRARVN